MCKDTCFKPLSMNHQTTGNERSWIINSLYQTVIKKCLVWCAKSWERNSIVIIYFNHPKSQLVEANRACTNSCKSESDHKSMATPNIESK